MGGQAPPLVTAFQRPSYVSFEVPRSLKHLQIPIRRPPNLPPLFLARYLVLKHVKVETAAGRIGRIESCQDKSCLEVLVALSGWRMFAHQEPSYESLLGVYAPEPPIRGYYSRRVIMPVCLSPLEDHDYKH